jgi:alginate O-acetyltransferase complex protein AlgI
LKAVSFTSLPFVMLAGVTFLLYYLPALKDRQITILIAASLFFYAYGQPYLLALFLASATINALCSFRVLQSEAREEKIRWALGGIIVNLGVLGFFKYGPLVSHLAFGSAARSDPVGAFLIALPLPIGISFYTFHGISLLIDVLKRGNPHPDIGTPEAPDNPARSFPAHFHRSLLYLGFFPQLIAGPIVKAHYFYPQILPKSVKDIDCQLAIRALITGYFLKRVLADNLQDQTFWMTYPYFLNLSGLDLGALLFGYSMQIFADFAGYSLIAIGLAALFGYRLPTNFNFPYIAQTFSEFWTRWHMSLSSFLREYLYYPLGGNRIGQVRTYANLMIVMALGGLWHGAALSYAAWGAWHGVALVTERLFRKTWFYRSSHPVVTALRIAIVFGFVSLAWLLFKLPHFEEVIAYVKAMAQNIAKHPSPVPLVITALLSIPVLGYHALHWIRQHRPGIEALRPALYGLMLAALVLNSGRSNAFIYFQF